jgi:hypothetical protein
MRIEAISIIHFLCMRALRRVGAPLVRACGSGLTTAALIDALDAQWQAAAGRVASAARVAESTA